MDFLASKGLEYLLVIGYLLALTPFLYFLAPRRRAAPRQQSEGWFTLPGDRHFHLGHAWAAPSGHQRLRVGLDDFAAHLLGAPQDIDLPADGELLEASKPGWQFQVDGESIAMLSPVSGRVVARNEALRERPELAVQDPYGEGWLLELEDSPQSSLRTLLSGELARAWMRQAEAGLRSLLGGQLGPVLQDGGEPVADLARQLAPESWDRLARRLLLVD